ncbi:MAG: hypothetical protein HY296_01375 [Thaumarchaeota archaeon]|nr:hypothetical protein [Nitrososphaerota archaeon]
MRPSEDLTGPQVSTTKGSIVRFYAVAVLGSTILLISPFELAKVLVAPWYLLVFPGASFLLFIRRDLEGLIDFLLWSFMVSVLVTFAGRTLFWYLRLNPQMFNWLVESWVLGFLLLAALRVRNSPGGEIRLPRFELILAALAVTVFAFVSVLLLNSPYTPLTDELHYLSNAKILNLFSSFPYRTSNHIGVFNFLVSRPLWPTELSTFFAMTSSGLFTGRVMEVFFFTVVGLSAFALTNALSGARAGFVASILAFSTPAVIMWTSFAMIDLVFAVFTFLGYVFFLKSLRAGNSRSWEFRFPLLVLAALSFLFAFLTKPGNLIVFVVVYVGFLFALSKSTIKLRKLLLSSFVALPLAYLALDFTYNFYTYVAPDPRIKSVLLPILPYSFFQQFFTLEHPLVSFQPISRVNPIYLLQGLYTALVSPYLLTYPVIFLALAGIIRSVKSNAGTLRLHLLLSVPVLLLGGLLSAIFLNTWEIPRNAIFLTPFLICFAAVGFSFKLEKLKGHWLLACALLVAAFFLLEPTMLVHGGIPVGIYPAPNQLRPSFGSVSFVLGLMVVLWKGIQGSRLEPKVRLPKRVPFPRQSHMIVVGLIALVSLSQAVVLVQGSSYLGKDSFGPLKGWLDTSIRRGDIILTNANQTITFLANDTLLQMIKEKAVHVIPIPPGARINSTRHQFGLLSSSQYLVVFKVAQYTDYDVYTERNYALVRESSLPIVESTIADVYEGIGLILLVQS